MSKKVLLMHISEISGHRSATLAIEAALKNIDSSVEIKSINALTYISPVSGRIINAIYMGVIKRLPGFWGWMYDNPKVVSFLEPIKNSLHNRKATKIDKLITEFKPDVVVFTQAYPCGIVSHYKRLNKLKLPLIAVLTDFAPHAYWVYDEVNYYVVPSNEAKDKLIQRGVPDEKIKLLGIPIDPKFSFTSDKASTYRKLGFNPDLKTILIMGGGHGLGPLDKIASDLDKIENCDFQMIAVAGVNKEIRSKIDNIKKGFRKRIVVFDFVNNINELMDISDIIITKAGGLTTAESLAKSLAMIIIKPIPGQEINNTDFLVGKGIGISANSINDVVSSVKYLVCQNEALEKMRLQAKTFSKPESSVGISKLILGIQ